MTSIVEVFPQEVLDRILDYFGSQHGGLDWEDLWWAALPTLKACSLACKRFRHRSQYHIFTLIRLHDRIESIYTLKQRSSGLCDVLSARPHLACGSHHVTIAFHRRGRFEAGNPRDVHTLVSKGVGAILKSFVEAGASIATLSIATPATEGSPYTDLGRSDIQEDDEDLGSCIDLATITCLIVQGRLPISVISATPNLKHLWMYNRGVYIDVSQERRMLSKRPEIRTLRLSGSSVPCLQVLLDTTPLLDLHNLQSLDVDPSGKFPVRLSSCFPSVRHLRIDHGLEAILPSERAQRLHFSSFKSLRTLYVEFDLDRTPLTQPPRLFFHYLRYCLVRLPKNNLESVNLRFRVYPQLFQEDSLILSYPWPVFWEALDRMIKRVGACEIRVDFLERFWPLDGTNVEVSTPSPAVDVFLRGQVKNLESPIVGANSVCTFTHTL